MYKELLKKTRSYRNFDKDYELSDDFVKGLIELTRYAPSTANTQPLKFAYACDKEMCDKIFPLTRWAGYLTKKPPYNGNVPTGYILVCYDTDISPQSPEVDVGICSQVMVLGAMEQGIGACMIGSINKPELKNLFKLPDNIIPRLIIALGKPAETVEIVDIVNGDVKYYRDGEQKHFVPKRTLDEILL